MLVMIHDLVAIIRPLFMVLLYSAFNCNYKNDRLSVRRILNISTTLHQAGYSLLPVS
jgi:hypothetical protein